MCTGTGIPTMTRVPVAPVEQNYSSHRAPRRPAAHQHGGRARGTPGVVVQRNQRRPGKVERCPRFEFSREKSRVAAKPRPPRRTRGGVSTATRRRGRGRAACGRRAPRGALSVAAAARRAGGRQQRPGAAPRAQPGPAPPPWSAERPRHPAPRTKDGSRRRRRRRRTAMPWPRRPPLPGLPPPCEPASRLFLFSSYLDL